ncbi:MULTISPECIES: sensor histidine kinase [unclassified Lentimicrobium]|uniref:sensor histidine kinase n=1 Tax=unclassified Lentimicrobium TaxID=2677434 RepID=UPI001552F8EA|nr:MULTISPECIES: histidine kinase [unclassified Lentimicrobium]NPD44054.1 histidine kinase [Lentimicrobium sp. S6]NPD85906.1 histidine kinase [Lentimicrobium sp. L6]
MKKAIKQNPIFRRTEIILITVMWLIMIFAPILFRNTTDSLTWEVALKPLDTLGLVFLLFLINRFFLVPKLLFKKKTIKYFASVIALIALVTIGFQFFLPKDTLRSRHEMQNSRRMPPPPDRQFSPNRNQNLPPMQNLPGQPLPPFINLLIFSFLTIGFDTGLRASFEWAKSEKEKEELEKENVENLLEMLRHQVSPHFFMNTLNNIHTLIDISGESAKDAVMKLSKMMRYLLYETSNDTTTVQKETEFIESYVELMKLRVSEKVDIQVNMPSHIPNKNLPPLLFTSFIENAFKHGVSYQKASFIYIDLKVDENKLILEVKNSQGAVSKDEEGSGIGLENVKKRLKLLYQKNFILNISDTPEQYAIHLSIPLS